MTGIPESYTHHKIGGYPLFEQRDPRDGDAALTQYTVNLLTLISDVKMKVITNKSLVSQLGFLEVTEEER